MKPDSTRARRYAGLGVFALLFWAVAFAAAYGQAPLYYSNQNQYFQHGLAAAGRGDLAHDWLTTTRDPTPVFSAAVAWIYSSAGEWAFYAACAVLMGVYFISIVTLIDATLGLPRSRPARFVLLTLLVAVHAIAVRWASFYITGTVVPMYLHRPMAALDIPRYLQFGVAAQYLLGPGLQPSVFGVLLVTSLAAFARGRLFLAAAFTAAACAIHASSLLSAALLTLAYVIVLIRDRRWGAALFVGAATLVAVLPVVHYVRQTFGPTTPEQYAEAQRLLAEVRIPHHAIVSQWFDRIAQLQVAWVALAILFSWGTRLFPLLAIPAIGSVLLTLAQLAPGNPAVMDWLRTHGVGQETLDKVTAGRWTLALLFPWRISAVLVPVATAAILTRVVTFMTPYPGRPAWWGWFARAAAAILLAALVAGGLYITIREPGLMYPTDDAELPMLAFVESHRQPDEVYLIPVDLVQFRLTTGAAVYVNWAAVPYYDLEVLEWHQRTERAKRWYAANDWDAVHDELVKAGITHVVAPAEMAAAAEGATTLQREFADGAFQVYRVRR